MKLREVFPIIESCEAWLSQGRTGNDWKRRMRFASFIDQVKIYREKAEKWDKLIEALSEGIIDKDDLVNLEYGPEELQTSDEKEVQS